jgi:hypothetical protein
MLEPITPSHRPEKPTIAKDEKPLGQADNIGDSEGYRFNFFGGPKKKKQSKKKDAAEAKNVYNSENAVKLNLSPEAESELEKQRQLKEKNSKKQDNE